MAVRLTRPWILVYIMRCQFVFDQLNHDDHHNYDDDHMQL